MADTNFYNIWTTFVLVGKHFAANPESPWDGGKTVFKIHTVPCRDNLVPLIYRWNILDSHSQGHI